MAVDLSSTHFVLFGLPQSFDVDQVLLETHYRELQRTVHPDRFVNAPSQERRLSMQQATRINEGYQTLKDPLRRGRYLLELAGYQFSEEHHTTSDSRFLMEQMELREALGDIREASDPMAALGKIMERITADFDELTGELRRQLEEGDEESLGLAADTLMKMQFFRRLEEEATALETILEDEMI